MPLEAIYGGVGRGGRPVARCPCRRAGHRRGSRRDGPLWLTSATIGEAIGRINRFADAFVSGERYRWLIISEAVVHEFVPYGSDRPAHRQVAELVFFDLARNTGRLFGVDLAPIEIRFSHRRAPGVDYDALFGTTVCFDQPRNYILRRSQ